MKRAAALVVAVLLLAGAAAMSGAPDDRMIGINVVLKGSITNAALAELGRFGRIRDELPALNAVTMQARESELAAIQALAVVASASPDAERTGAPIDTVGVDDFADGFSTWNLDAINVTDVGFDNRKVSYDGSGVYVAVLDSGLLDSWRQYFPEERIAVEYARSFGGGGGEVGTVSSQPNKWEHDQNSHGTHVTSTVLGYQFGQSPVNGVAPMATVIPVKVLNQTGSGWSSVIARGIVYVADLKAGPLARHPVVINMSLSGARLDAVEKAAIDYAISKGVIIVASAGNRGEAGMGYPAAYGPVISVAASGWLGEWATSNWWYALNDPDPLKTQFYYIADFSSRAKSGQDLDVAAPGSWVLGPYQTNSGKTSYYFLGGTSMASPHVAGIVALMAQKNSALTAAQAETYLENSAIYLAPGCRDVYNPGGTTTSRVCWGGDATGKGLATADAALNIMP
jgi:subtilisin family serine protease